jgi:hypothetical protein
MISISPGEARTFVLAHTPVWKKLRLEVSIFELYPKMEEEEEEEEEELEHANNTTHKNWNTPERYLIGRKEQTFAPDNGWDWDIWGQQQADMHY